MKMHKLYEENFANSPMLILECQPRIPYFLPYSILLESFKKIRPQNKSVGLEYKTFKD
jgi:hypothetical protein